MSSSLWVLIRVVLDLGLLGFGVYCLLLAYRRIGKPEGVDPQYDAQFRFWSGTYKFLGWGWVVLSTLALIISLGSLIGQSARP
jgi:hypothetical protein